jgi:hypothetical protein
VLRGDLPFIPSFADEFAPFARFALFFDSAGGPFGCKSIYSLLMCQFAIVFRLEYNST